MNIEDEYVLKWNNHQSNLSDSVSKDWVNNQSYVDVTLVCRGQTLVSHKVVLASCSPLFDEILHTNPCQHPVVIFNELNYDDMKAILKFVYEGEVSVSQDDLAGFLQTAENLKIKGLAFDCLNDKKRKNYSEKEPDENTAKKSKNSNNSKPKKLEINCVAKEISHDRISCPTLNDNLYSQNPETNSSSDYIEQETIMSVETHSFNQEKSDEDKVVVKMEKSDFSSDLSWEERGDCGSFRDVGNGLNDSSDRINDFQNPNAEISSTLPYEDLHTLEWLSSGQDFISKGSDNTDANKDGLESLTNSNEELISTPVFTTYEEASDDFTAPGKFRSRRKPCYFCGKTFCDNYTLRRHIATHLSRQRQFTCSICPAAYSRKDHLKAHVKRKHPGTNYESDTNLKSKFLES